MNFSNKVLQKCLTTTILTMRMAFDQFKEFPGRALKFIADGYSAYPLTAQQFKIEKDWDVSITQVIGLTNDDEVSKKFRLFRFYKPEFYRLYDSLLTGCNSNSQSSNGLSGL